MKTVKQILSMLLVCSMLLGFLPSAALAAAGEGDAAGGSLAEGTFDPVSAIHINPEYEHLGLELPPPDESVGTADTETATVDSLEAAGDYLRTQMEAPATMTTPPESR